MTAMHWSEHQTGKYVFQPQAWHNRMHRAMSASTQPAAEIDPLQRSPCSWPPLGLSVATLVITGDPAPPGHTLIGPECGRSLVRRTQAHRRQHLPSALIYGHESCNVARMPRCATSCECMYKGACHTPLRSSLFSSELPLSCVPLASYRPQNLSYRYCLFLLGRYCLFLLGHCDLRAPLALGDALSSLRWLSSLPPPRSTLGPTPALLLPLSRSLSLSVSLWFPALAL